MRRFFDKARDGDLLSAIVRRLKCQAAHAIGQGMLKEAVVIPSVRDVVAGDPSEAIRSGDIVKVVQEEFEIVEQKAYGGNVIQFLLAGIAGNFSARDAHSQLLLEMLFNIEDTLIRCGEFTSDYAYIVARPRKA